MNGRIYNIVNMMLGCVCGCVRKMMFNGEWMLKLGLARVGHM